MKPLETRRNVEAAPLIPGGSWSDVAGTRVGVASGRLYGTDRDDVVILDAPGTAAAVVTRSTAVAPPCRWTRERVPGPARAVVINAGNANAATGRQGVRDVRATAERVAAALECEADEVLVCSTGVIGVPLPMDRLLPAVDEAAASLEADGRRAAGAVLTTDLVPKEAACTLDGITVAGFAKGSGMIHPDMATMLGFLVTDAKVEPGALQALLEDVNGRTFNAISVDSDCSTNDTVILQATGRGPEVRPGDAGWTALARALETVTRSLAKAIARDGEGAEHLIHVLVEGTDCDEAARRAARTVAASPLVKTAIHGRDANWGRVVMALGKAGVEGLDALSLDFAGIPVLREGSPVPFDEAAATAAMGAEEVLVHAQLPGPGVGEAWGCDLTDGYVRINADYRS
ncbi:MAG: bifunctional glutamate N-acetyltransferase/amino-acid acetyltransferase ArgJ [Myxococcota bacterium]